MARRRKAPDPEQQRDKLLAAYLQWWESDSGRLVLSDLKAIYQDRSSLTEPQGEDILVNRMLVAEGARLVYLKIIGMIREAKNHATGNDNSRAEFGTDDLDADLERLRADFDGLN